MFGKNPVGLPEDDGKSTAPTGRTLRLVHEAVLEAAAQCCAVEGSYPSTIEYLGCMTLLAPLTEVAP